MEISRGWAHTAFPIDDASRVGEARRFAGLLTQELDWTEVEAGRLALVVTELGTNLLRHAQRGRLLIAVRPAFDDVEVISIDEGPGITDLAKSMRDGYSTGGGSPGTGLGAIRRLASDFDLYSTPADNGKGGGTVCVARVRAGQTGTPARGSIQVGAVALCAPGETVNGDGWAVATDGADASLMLADGLGHGPEAAKASSAAADVFLQQPFADTATFLGDAHAALQTTRGAAICCLRMGATQVRCSGAGNVVVRIVSGVFDRSMVTQHGTVGMQMRRAQEAVMELPEHALAIVHSDGIETRWDSTRLHPLIDRDPALIAAVLLRDHCRGRDDATVVVLRRVP